MERAVLARFDAREGGEEAVAIAETMPGAEPGCLAIAAYRRTRDPRLFTIHSRWTDEAAFDLHAGLPHTVRFLVKVQPLIDHPLGVTRARAMG